MSTAQEENPTHRKSSPTEHILGHSSSVEA